MIIWVLLAFFVPWASAASQDSLNPFLFPSEYTVEEPQTGQGPLDDTEKDLFNEIEESDEETASKKIVDAQTEEPSRTDADTALVGPPTDAARQAPDSQGRERGTGKISVSESMASSSEAK
ncbi:MAG: hypothetical protein OXF23_05715, partial [Candidatus Dadabacteria bacterium]|nr:hypothetical protein [Candidatus Dadabacteria bacterium]